MKRLAFALAAAWALAGVTAPARAQVFGQFTSAEIVPVNGHLFGAYLQASENTVGLAAQLRLSFYPGVDFGFQGGLDRIDAAGGDLTTVRLGGDFRYQMAHADASMPVDLTVGAALGVETGDDISVLSVGPVAAVSRNLQVGSSGGFTPYAGIGLLFSNLDVRGDQNTDLSIPMRLGSEFRISTDLRIVAELQLRLSDDFNDHVGFVTGVNLPF